MNYKQIKEMQKRDIKSGTSHYFIYRHISTPFTWIFVKLGIQPNTITILSFFLCLIGFYFLSLSHFLIGLSFFLFFNIMDMCDGEIARIRNEVSNEGRYFDRISHYIFVCCFGFGLGLGLSKLYQNEIFILLGFVFTSVLIIENAKNDLLNPFKEIITKRVYKNHTWAEGNIVKRAIGIYPFQGLIFNDTFIIIPVLFMVFLIEFFLNIPFLIPFYLILISLVKGISFVMFNINMKKAKVLE